MKRFFSSSLFSAIRVVSSAYLRLLIFLPEILIPACSSSSLAFCLMSSACKLNKQGDNIQPWHTPFPNWKQSVAPCPVLTVSSWPAYRFLERQVRWPGISFSTILKYCHLKSYFSNVFIFSFLLQVQFSVTHLLFPYGLQSSFGHWMVHIRFFGGQVDMFLFLKTLILISKIFVCPSFTDLFFPGFKSNLNVLSI